MEEVLHFLEVNWRFLAEILLLLASLIVACLRKRKTQVKIDESIVSELPGLVVEAESKYGPGHGQEKLQYVVARITSRLSFNNPDLSLSDLEPVVLRCIEQVEAILSTPEKKKGE